MSLSKTTNLKVDTLVPELILVVQSAGAAILAARARGVKSQLKDDGSPVTQADKLAEALILPALKDLTPRLPIISEENAESHTLRAPSRFWLVDPLDGTKEFLKTDGSGGFTVNIALIEDGVPVLGLVYAPALDRLFVGYKASAFTIDSRGERSLTVRQIPQTGAVAVASASHYDRETDAWLKIRGIGQTLSIGSSLKFCLVASGEADVYPRFSPTMEWDTAAGDAVLRAAGGMVERPDGVPFPYGKPGYRNGAFIAFGDRH